MLMNRFLIILVQFLAPWYIIPADRKWFTRVVVADIICTKLEALNLQYPTVSDEDKQRLVQAKYMLEQEN